MLEHWRVAFQLARTAYPLIEVEESEFFAHLERLGYETQLPAFTSHIYLCYACATGARAACRYFERDYGGALQRSIKRLCSNECLRDDVLQCVLEKFLVGPTPTLLKYAGVSPFDAWLGLATRRVVLDHMRGLGRQARSQLLSNEQLIQYSVSGDPERDAERVLDRLQCEGLLGRALGEALAEMSIEQREVLRLRFLSGLGTDAMAALRGVHRATITRWVEQSLRSARALLRRRLAATGTLSEPELRCVVALMDGKTDVLSSRVVTLT